MLAIAPPPTCRPTLRIDDRGRALRLVIELHGVLMRIAQRCGFPGAMIPPLQSTAEAATIVAGIEPMTTPGERRVRYQRSLACLGETAFCVDLLYASGLLVETDRHSIYPKLTRVLHALDLQVH